MLFQDTYQLIFFLVNSKETIYHQQLLQSNRNRISYNPDKRPITNKDIFHPNNRLVQSRHYIDDGYIQGRNELDAYGRNNPQYGYRPPENYESRSRGLFRFPSN